MISHRIFNIEVAFKMVYYIWALLPGSKFTYAFQLHSCVAETRKLKIFVILREFPSGLMFRILGFLCQGPGSIPGQGTKILQATWCGQKTSQFPYSHHSKCDLILYIRMHLSKFWIDFVFSACSVSQLCRTHCNPWTVAHQAPQFMEFSRQEYWSESLLPPPRNLPSPGTKPTSLVFPALAGRFFTTAPPGKQRLCCKIWIYFRTELFRAKGKTSILRCRL